MADADVNLKILVDKKCNGVLFAEADKNFIDFLFNIFTMPFGILVGLLTEQDMMVGSLGNLYGSIEKLNDAYIIAGKNKDSVLKPKTLVSGSDGPLLLPDSGSSSTSPVIYHCGCDYNYGCRINVSTSPGAICPRCNSQMTNRATLVEPKVPNTGFDAEKKGYVKGVVSYMVMDNLVIQPMSTISSITLLNKFNIKDTGSLEERVVKVTMKEALRLLRASLQSNTVLTDVFLQKEVAVHTMGQSPD